MLEPKYNIAIFGHSKSGKSTIGGRLLHEYKSLSKKQIDLFDKEAKKKGSDYNKYNITYLSRSTAIWHQNKEGDNSRTVYPDFGNIKLISGHTISLVDTPGHIKWINNIIYSAHLADQAFITISSLKGIEKGTLEVFKILNSFNIPIIGILITKMDSVNYSNDVYYDIINSLETDLLQKYNIKLSEITKNIIPVSALSEDGVGINSLDNVDWYKGNTVKQLLENNQYFSNIENHDDVRFIVEGTKDVYSVPSVGTIVVGTLEIGKLKIGDYVILQPASFINNKVIKYKVRNIQFAKSVTGKANDNLKTVEARNIISVLLSGAKPEILKNQLKKGGVFSLSKISIANEIETEIDFFEPENIYIGQEFVLHTNSTFSIAVIKNILESDDSKRHLTLSLKTPTYIESNVFFNRLTRFLLRTNNEVIGCGICKDIIR